jgi:hypothetical protein
LSYQRSYAGEPGEAAPAFAAAEVTPTPTAVELVAFDEAKVRIHRGDRADAVAGVRVHRTAAPVQVAAVSPIDVPQPASAPAASDGASTVEGVTIHVR